MKSSHPGKPLEEFRHHGPSGRAHPLFYGVDQRVNKGKTARGPLPQQGFKEIDQKPSGEKCIFTLLFPGLSGYPVMRKSKQIQ